MIIIFDIFVLFILYEGFSFWLLTEKIQNKHKLQLKKIIKVDIYPTSTLSGKSIIAPYIKCKMTLISTWLMLQKRKEKNTNEDVSRIKRITFLSQRKLVKSLIYHPAVLWMEGKWSDKFKAIFKITATWKYLDGLYFGWILLLNSLAETL